MHISRNHDLDSSAPSVHALQQASAALSSLSDIVDTAMHQESNRRSLEKMQRLKASELESKMLAEENCQLRVKNTKLKEIAIGLLGKKLQIKDARIGLLEDALLRDVKIEGYIGPDDEDALIKSKNGTVEGMARMHDVLEHMEKDFQSVEEKLQTAKGVAGKRREVVELAQNSKEDNDLKDISLVLERLRRHLQNSLQQDD